jgi:hypothetical protein
VVDHVLIDSLTFKGNVLAGRWKDRIRKLPQLKTYNALSDEQLVAMNAPLYPQLARILEYGLDRSTLGGFFVRMGKDQMQAGHPISETVLALNICRKVVIELVENDVMLDNSIQLYQTIELSSKIAEFFFLGCFYLTKGFLEAIYSQMNTNDNISETFLKKYFKDDFFFKKEDQ